MAYTVNQGMNYHGEDAGFIALKDSIAFTGNNITVERGGAINSSGKFRRHGNSGIGYLVRGNTKASIAVSFGTSSMTKPSIRILVSTLPTASDDTAGEWEGEEILP